MINQNRRLLNTLNHNFLAGFFVFCLVAVIGIIGCSSGGGGGNKTEYHLAGYDGVSDSSPSGDQGLVSAIGNTGLNFYSPFPWFVNLTFQAFDKDMWGVPDLVVGNFSVMEDGIEVSQINSEMNIRKRDFLPSAYSYTIKTVLLLDNSPSTSLNLDKMIEAAQVVVDNIDEKQQQEIAIVAYDEAGDFTVLQDFTSNISVLNEILINLEPSYGTTNFYGAVINSLALFDDNQSPASTEFVQGFVVAITDGQDTSNLNDVDDAIAARRDQQVITVAGGDLPEQTLIDLERLGNSGYYPVPNPNQDPDEAAGKKPEDENLCEWMLVIQDRMMAYADSFYWIQYKSTATSADANPNHNVSLTIIDNSNEDIDNKISGTFTSENFFSGTTSIYFNASAADPAGITDLAIIIERGQGTGEVTSPVSALTYSNDSNNPSQYEWSSEDKNVVTVKVDPNDSSKATITVIAPGETQIVVTDTANNVQQTFAVSVKINDSSFEFIKYELESTAPWFVDVTFQVRDTESENNQWSWITDLMQEDFTIIENESSEPVDLDVSEVNLRKRDDIPSSYSYTLKTVLLIDNTPSIGSDNLDLIKDAAKAFVARALENNPDDDSDMGPLLDKKDNFQQKIAIWTYTEDGLSLPVLNFTSDKEVLDNAIDAINRGYNATDFYGAMINALNSWDNDHSPNDGNNELQQGVLIVFSDGNHSFPGFYDRNAVLSEIGNKQVITVGVGDDLISAVNQDLVEFGNAGFYSVPSPGEKIVMKIYSDNKNPEKSRNVTYTDLEKTLIGIQDELVDFANSFYWLNYKSYVEPAANCNDTEQIDITINNNRKEEANDSLSGQFESCEFFDGNDGAIYVNSTVVNPWGENGPIELVYDRTRLFFNSEFNLEAFTYNHENTPDYEWLVANENIVSIEVDENSYANSRAVLKIPVEDNMPGSTVLRVIDRGNSNVFKNITVNVSEIDLPLPIAYYPFNGNADDETGNGYDGAALGATLTTDRNGNKNSAYSFDGEDDYIALDMFYGEGAGAVSDSIDELTVCAWIKVSSSSSSMRVVSFDYPNFWELFVSDGHVILASIRYGDPDAVITSGKYNDDQWHFICGTLLSNGKMELYIDGMPVSVNDWNSSLIAGTDNRYGFIGVDGHSNVYNILKIPERTYFQGSIDDVMIFDAALTDDQIDFIYNLGDSKNK